MRCPKCGYISFDSVDECVKCRKNIKSASDSLPGAVPSVSPPSFLQFRNSRTKSAEEESDFASDISPFESEFPVQESAALSEGGGIQLDGDTDEIEMSGDSFAELRDEGETADINIDEDEDPEGEIEVDLSQFEEVSDPEAAFLSKDNETDEEGDVMQISVPDELNDMSDLAPPSYEDEDEDEIDLELNLDDDSDDLELDDLNFDLELDDMDGGDSSEMDPVQETVLSLDDIEFSNDLSDDGGRGSSDSSSMDGDLDFDLDLGGLSIHKDV